jgi:hypothetical protein
MELTMKKYSRLAAAGALGVSAGAAALYLMIAYGAVPVRTGGIDNTNAVLTWVSAAVPIGGIIAAHLVYAMQLFKYGKKQG